MALDPVDWIFTKRESPTELALHARSWYAGNIFSEDFSPKISSRPKNVLRHTRMVIDGNYHWISGMESRPSHPHVLAQLKPLQASCLKSSSWDVSPIRYRTVKVGVWSIRCFHRRPKRLNNQRRAKRYLILASMSADCAQLSQTSLASKQANSLFKS